MPITLNGTRVYRISEALQEAGLSRATYFRWVREGKVADTRYRDRNGRRVFMQGEMEELKRTAHRLVEASPQIRLSFGGAPDG